MIHQLRRPNLAWMFGVIVLGAVATARCGGGTTASGPQDVVNIAISQFDIEVENISGGTLFELRVAIVPVGGATKYSAFTGRLDAGYKQRFGFNDFRGDDGTPFSLRLMKPQSVLVTAKDREQKEIEIQVPWKIS